MNKRLLLLSCIVATNAFAVEYWYDVNDACSYRWCKTQPAAGTCCSSANSVTKLPSANRTGYTLRGWTKSSVDDADGNAGQLFGFVAGANANLSDISVTGAMTFRAAWAKNCKSSITGGTCDLTIGDKGSVTYTTSANNGYECDSGCNTSDPTFEQVIADVSENWITFTLNDDNDNVNASSPIMFACQTRNNTRSGCARGCYKTKGNCSNDNKFTGLTSIPKKTNFAYDGHFAGNNKILDESGELNSTNWASVSGTDVEIIAHWTENKIKVNKNKGNCEKVEGISAVSCNVNGSLNLGSATPKSGQNFDGWLINGVLNTNSSVLCNRDTLGGNVGDVVTITAQCSATGGGTEEPSNPTEPDQPNNIVNLTYVRSCENQSGCPSVPSGYPQTCTSGQSVIVPTGYTVSEGWSFDGWIFDGTVYTAGKNFTCPSADATITVKFTKKTQWHAITLNDDNADTPSKPQYLCCDTNGVTSGWYAANSSNCTGAAVIANLTQLPVKSGYTYNGHQLSGNTYLVDENGNINTSVSCADVSNVSSVSADWRTEDKGPYRAVWINNNLVD